MVRRGFVTRRGKSVRETMWVSDNPSVTTLASASSATIIGFSAAPLLAVRPFTVIRTVGWFSIRSDQTATSESYDGAIGYCVVSEQALAIGITAVPTPFTDLESDLWFVHQMKMDRFLFISGVGVVPLMTRGFRYESKGARKVNDDEDYIVVGETSAVSTGAVIHHASRSLIKLH